MNFRDEYMRRIMLETGSEPVEFERRFGLPPLLPDSNLSGLSGSVSVLVGDRGLYVPLKLGILVPSKT
jgi:hypothetical protein